MKIAVTSLSERPTSLEATMSPKELDLTAKHTRFEAPVQVAATVTRMQEDVLAEGKATTTAVAECSPSPKGRPTGPRAERSDGRQAACAWTSAGRLMSRLVCGLRWL